MSLPGLNPGRYAFTLQKSMWVNSTQVEPGFILGSFCCSVNRAFDSIKAYIVLRHQIYQCIKVSLHQVYLYKCMFLSFPQCSLLLGYYKAFDHFGSPSTKYLTIKSVANLNQLLCIVMRWWQHLSVVDCCAAQTRTNQPACLNRVCSRSRLMCWLQQSRCRTDGPKANARKFNG